MIVNELNEKQISKIFAHYAYRNTLVEDLHAGDSVTMDEDVYAQVYAVVKKQIRKIKRNHPLLLSFKSKAGVERALTEMYYPLAKEFLDYYNEMCCYTLYPQGGEWDEPVFLQETDIPNDLASYILGGAFLQCCRERRVLDDRTMCYINKDVYNRLYTLVCEQRLWKIK